MTSIAQPTVSLREIAAAAWTRQQEEAAEARRQEIQRARDAVISGTRVALELAFANPATDPWRAIDRHAAQEADVTVVEPGRTGAVTFLGERFESRREGYGWGLYHLFTCTVCGGIHESTHEINSLADLGAWLEQAATVCLCQLEATDGAN